MEAIKKAVVEFFKKIREGLACASRPPKPKNMNNCVHYGRAFEYPDKSEGEPILECRHINGNTEYILRYPKHLARKYCTAIYRRQDAITGLPWILRVLFFDETKIHRHQF